MTKAEAEANGLARCELALAELRPVLSTFEYYQVVAAAQDVLDEGWPAAVLAEDLEEGRQLLLGDVAVH